MRLQRRNRKEYARRMEEIMDTFIDKLAQKFSAQEMIKANTTAEAKENHKLREQVEAYETMLQEIKQVNLKNLESAERVSRLTQESSESLRENAQELQKALTEEREKNPAADKTYLEGLFEKADDSLHKENIKVYRNVQAVINDGLKEQTDALTKEIEASKSKNTFFKVMSILILIAVLADIALQVIRILGVL